MLAAFGAWLLGWAIKIASSGVIDKLVTALAKSDEGKAKLEEIRGRVAERVATEDAETARARIAALNARQSAKMNQPVFWTIIAVMMGPPALILWSVAIYNIVWWQHGIWPQTWSIADFPASIKPWAQAAIDWLYDPLGAPSSVGAAAVAGWLTGKR